MGNGHCPLLGPCTRGCLFDLNLISPCNRRSWGRCCYTCWQCESQPCAHKGNELYPTDPDGRKTWIIPRKKTVQTSKQAALRGVELVLVTWLTSAPWQTRAVTMLKYPAPAAHQSAVAPSITCPSNFTTPSVSLSASYSVNRLFTTLMITWNGDDDMIMMTSRLFLPPHDHFLQQLSMGSSSVLPPQTWCSPAISWGTSSCCGMITSMMASPPFVTANSFGESFHLSSKLTQQTIPGGQVHLGKIRIWPAVR